MPEFFNDPQKSYGSSKMEPVILPDFQFSGRVRFKGLNYKTEVRRLLPDRSLSFVVDESFWCECRDLAAIPRTYQLHMYLGMVSPDVSFAVKLERMRNWESAIEFFDARKKSLPDNFSAGDLIDLCRSFYIPQPELAEFNTEVPGLSRLFSRLGYSDVDNAKKFVTDWSTLADDARTGRFLQYWIAIRREYYKDPARRGLG